jgi:hypothetical protein
VLDGDKPETRIVAVDGEKVPFSMTPKVLTAVVHIGLDKNPPLHPVPLQGRTSPMNLRAFQLLPGDPRPKSTVRYSGVEVVDALKIAERTGILLSAYARSRRAAANGAK